jgi:hypothetical protein
MAEKSKKEVVRKERAITVEFIPSLDPKLGKVYANYAQISHSPWDFTVRFCEAPPSADLPRLIKPGEKNIEIPNVVEVVMAPDLIPLVISALTTNYEKYIKTYKVKVDEPIN